VSVQLTSPPVGELVGRLRAVLERRYHHLHPFNQRMHRGELSRQELQLWVANRFYYQISIPIKDALILSSCPEREVRQHWIQRIIDHDGRPGEEGGIEAWLRLGEAMGVKREDLVGQRFLLPGVCFAVDAYVNFCRFRPWLEAVAASLTEMFAPLIVKERLAAMLSHYSGWIPRGCSISRTGSPRRRVMRSTPWASSQSASAPRRSRSGRSRRSSSSATCCGACSTPWSVGPWPGPRRDRCRPTDRASPPPQGAPPARRRAES